MAERIERGLVDGPLTEAGERYRDCDRSGAVKDYGQDGDFWCLSYRGGLNFEAVGLSRAMCAEYFPGMTSRISGWVSAVSRTKPKRSCPWMERRTDVLPIGGFYKARRAGETHAWEAQTMHMMQSACNSASYEMWKQYSAKHAGTPPIHLRDLMDFKAVGRRVPLEEVESITCDPQAVCHAGYVAWER